MLFRSTRNNLGSKVRPWLQNGEEVVSHDADVKLADNYPKELTNLSQLDHLYMGESHAISIAAFGSRAPFDIALTNDAIFQVTPLIYKLDTNTHIAHLVDFQPIRIKLNTKGTTQQSQ